MAVDQTGAEDGITNWSELFAETVRQLRAAGAGQPEADARWIIERATGEAWRETMAKPASVRSHHHWRLMVERRVAGEPLQYVLGLWAFRELELLVDRRVLIPRPETEVVVGAALAEIGRIGGVAVDLGVGSGAIALSIAHERPGTEVWGVEESEDALQVARANLAGLGRRATTVRFVHGSWFEPLPDTLRGTVAVIVSNPPYVTDDESLPPIVEHWEPARALRSGPDGLTDVRLIVGESLHWLAPGGALVVEHAPSQAEAVRQLARTVGFDHVETGRDLTGRDRFLLARRAG